MSQLKEAEIKNLEDFFNRLTLKSKLDLVHAAR